MSEPKATDVNLFDLETQRCPFDAYQTLRDEAPVYRCPYSGLYIVTRFDDVRRVLTDSEVFISRLASRESAAGPTDRERKVKALFEEEGWLPAATLSGRDDPNHKDFRVQLLHPLRTEGFVEETAHLLMVRIIPAGEGGGRKPAFLFKER
ncbi:MAG: hypothetical protein AAGE43_18580, partial [Pseudomonadota bacterium]